MDINSELYDGKSLADIFSEIHKNTDSKRAQINSFIMKMVQLIRTPEDAKSNASLDGLLSESEKEALLKDITTEIQDLQEDVKDLDDVFAEK